MKNNNIQSILILLMLAVMTLFTVISAGEAHKTRKLVEQQSKDRFLIMCVPFANTVICSEQTQEEINALINKASKPAPTYNMRHKPEEKGVRI